MILYVAMVNDRHSDPEPFIFETAAEAIAYARHCAHTYARHPEDIEESTVDGWLYHARYSVEGDSVWALTKTVGDKE